MKVLKALKKVWDQEYEYSDIKLISSESGISTNTISHALRSGKCSRNTMNHINAYFIRKRGIKKAETAEMINEIKSA